MMMENRRSTQRHRYRVTSPCLLCLALILGLWASRVSIEKHTSRALMA